jgi:hypothetical protein
MATQETVIQLAVRMSDRATLIMSDNRTFTSYSLETVYASSNTSDKITPKHWSGPGLVLREND